MRFLLSLITVGASLAAQESALPSMPPESRVDLSRVQLKVAPETVLAMLQSASAAERERAYQILGFGPGDSSDTLPPPARIAYVQLDQDDDLECVLSLQQMGVAIAFVFDRSGPTWWRVGRFTDGWRSVGNINDMIDLREITSPERYDLVVRSSGGGTDIAERDFTIYTLVGGALVRIFEITEQSRYKDGRTSGTVFEQAIIYYPERDLTGASTLLVDQYKSVFARNQIPPLPARDMLRSAARTCTVYRWNMHTNAFVPDSDLKETLCSSSRTPNNGTGSKGIAGPRR